MYRVCPKNDLHVPRTDWGRHELTRIVTQYTFLGGHSRLGFLDGIAGSLVVVTVSELVFAATVEDDFAALTAGELGGSTALVAERAVRIRRESHDLFLLQP